MLESVDMWVLFVLMFLYHVLHLLKDKL